RNDQLRFLNGDADASDVCASYALRCASWLVPGVCATRDTTSRAVPAATVKSAFMGPDYMWVGGGGGPESGDVTARAEGVLVVGPQRRATRAGHAALDT